MRPEPELDEVMDLAEEDAVHSDESSLAPDLPAYDAVITGGEGHGSGNARQLVVIQPLPTHADPLHPERPVPQSLLLQMLPADMREAAELARARLHAEAMKYSNQGFKWDLDDVVYERGARRIITATLRIAR